MVQEFAGISGNPLIVAPPLTLSILRLHYQCAEALRLPRWKGATLRGGLGWALKKTFCDRECNAGGPCPRLASCPYATIFAPEHDLPGSGGQDVPRPFVVRPPLHEQISFSVGDMLTFELVLIGSACAYTQHLIAAFTTLGVMGLGQEQKRATLTRVEQVHPLTNSIHCLCENGVFHAPAPACSSASVVALAEDLPPTLQLQLVTPARIKHAGQFVQIPECHVLVRALLRRLAQLSEHFGTEQWQVPFKDLIAQAQEVQIQQSSIQWVEWGRTSGGTGQHMQLGGMMGRVTYTDVPPAIRAILLLGSLVHVGKATVFGHGWYHLTG